MATIRNLLLRLGVDVDPLDKGFAKAAKTVETFDKHFSKIAKASAIGAGLGAATGAAVALSAALAPAAGALVAMPGYMLATRAAALTLRVGMQGVGEAMAAVAEGDAKELEKALKDLSPAAREFVKASGGLMKEFDGVRKTVQEKLFTGLAAEMKGVSGNVLPPLKSGMVDVAGALNGAAKEAIVFSRTPLASGLVSKVFASSKKMIETLTPAIQPALTGVTKLAEAGLPLAERMAAWVANGAKAAGAFLSSAEGAAKLTAWVQKSGDTLAQLGRIGKNFGTGLINTFSSAKFTGDGVLDTLEKLTAKFATWTGSAEGQSRMNEAFSLLLTILRSVVDVLPLFLGPLGAVLKLLTSMSPEMQEVVSKFLAFSLVAVALGSKLMPLLTGVKALTVASVAAGASVFKFGQGLLKGGAALGENAGAAAKAGAALRTFGSFMLSGIVTSSKLIASLALQAAGFIGVGLAAAGAAVKAIAFEVASKAVTVATKLWAAATWLLNAAMKANPIGIVITIITALIAIVVTAYNKNETFRKIVQAAWKGIQQAVSYAWNNIIKPVFKALFEFITNTLGPKISWLYNNIIKPIFTGIGKTISTVWTGVIKPVFTTLVTFITQTVPNAFSTGVKAIGTFWEKVKGIAKAPVTFLVNTVYNNGIRKVWNWVATKVGLPELAEIRGFATGGKIQQGTTGTADDVLIKASRGEYMVNAAATSRNIGLIDYVNRYGKNKDILKSSGLAGDPGGLGLPGYAEGGIIGWVKGFIQKGKDFFMAGFMKAAKAVLNPIVNLAKSSMGGTGFGSMLAGAVDKIVGGVLAKFTPYEAELGGGAGGRKAVAAARSQIGVPYSWGGGGPNGPSYGIDHGRNIFGFDCSGLMEYAWYQATKKSIGGVTYTQKQILKRISEPRPGAVGQPHPGHTYMATERGTLIEAPYTGAKVRETAMRSTPWWGWPPWATMDQGGVIRPGWNPPIWNGTGRTEGVFTSDMIKAMNGRGRGGNTYHMTVQVAPGTSPAETGRQIVAAIQEYERTNGTRWRAPK